MVRFIKVQRCQRGTASVIRNPSTGGHGVTKRRNCHQQKGTNSKNGTNNGNKIYKGLSGEKQAVCSWVHTHFVGILLSPCVRINLCNLIPKWTPSASILELGSSSPQHIKYVSLVGTLYFFLHFKTCFTMQGNLQNYYQQTLDYCVIRSRSVC